MKRLGPAALIGSNIVVDAFGTAVFSAGIGFFAIRWADAEPSDVLNWLTIGGLLGIGLSLFAASLVDSIGPKPILLVVQACQFTVYFGMIIDMPVIAVLALCALGAALGRIVSPVRGALPPLYLSKERLLEFKATVKVWTVTMAIAGGAVAAILGMQKNSAALVLIPLLNCVSFIVVFMLTLGLPDRGRPEKRARFGLYLPSAQVACTALLFAVLAGLGTVPGYGVAVLAADKLGVPSAIVGIAPAVSFSVAILGQQLAKGRSFSLRTQIARIVVVSLVLESTALACLYVISANDLGAISIVSLVVASSALAETGALIVAFALWDVQYNIGNDADRGGIVGVFTMASSLGLAAAPALTSALLFRGPWFAAVAGAAVVTTSVAGVLGARWAGRRAKVPKTATL